MLRDYVRTKLTAEQIGDLLTMAGFELEGIEEVDGESVLDIKVVSNRGDGLSVYGLAREVLAKDATSEATDLYAACRAGFADSPLESQALDDSVVQIESDECIRFAVRTLEGVDAKQSSPEWMQKRLQQAGMRPISILVDLTNYVMLELGQPLHAFDRDKLAGGRIVVRHARPGERLVTLNGVEHELNGQMMVCDAEKPVGVPGVMGGLETEVSDLTKTLLLESANFKNTAVRKTRKQLGLNTEASYRFERSVDPEGVVRATERFTKLLLEVQPAIKASNIVDHYPGRMVREPIKLRLSRANRLLGMTITDAEASRYLKNLGFSVDGGEGEYTIEPPSWRPDIVREDDLIEELGRVHGYEKIPEELPIGHTPIGGPQGSLLKVDLLREAVVRAGFIQIISHSLRDKHLLDAPGARIGPKNPGSPEMAWLRNSHLPSLAEAAIRNGAKDLHLFEMGKVFGDFGERMELSLLSVGALLPANWQKSDSGQADFFSLKEAVVKALSQIGYVVQVAPAEVSAERFHPTRVASLLYGVDQVGVMGQLHPSLAEPLGLSPTTAFAEVNISKLLSQPASEVKYQPISRNPSVRRDISIEVPKSLPYAEVENAVISACGSVLERHWLSDVYEGAGIGDGNRSLSLALQLRKQGENFTDEEANQVRELAVEALVALGARPR